VRLTDEAARCMNSPRPARRNRRGRAGGPPARPCKLRVSAPIVLGACPAAQGRGRLRAYLPASRTRDRRRGSRGRSGRGQLRPRVTGRSNHDERLVGRGCGDQRLLVAPLGCTSLSGWSTKTVLRLAISPRPRTSCNPAIMRSRTRQLRGLPADLPSCLAKMKPSFRHLLSVAVILMPAPGADHRCLHPAPRFIVPAV